MLIEYMSPELYQVLVSAGWRFKPKDVANTLAPVNKIELLLSLLPSSEQQAVARAFESNLPVYHSHDLCTFFFKMARRQGADLTQISVNHQRFRSYPSEYKKYAQALLATGVAVNYEHLTGEQTIVDAYLSDLYPLHIQIELACQALSNSWSGHFILDKVKLLFLFLPSVDSPISNDSLEQNTHISVDTHVAMQHVVRLTRALLRHPKPPQRLELVEYVMNKWGTSDNSLPITLPDITAMLRYGEASALDLLCQNKSVMIDAFEAEPPQQFKMGSTTISLPITPLTYFLRNLDYHRMTEEQCDQTTKWLLKQQNLDLDRSGALFCALRALGLKRNSLFFNPLLCLVSQLIRCSSMHPSLAAQSSNTTYTVDINLPCGDYTPLGYLVSRRPRSKLFTLEIQLSLIREMVEAGADVNSLRSGVTPLMWSAATSSGSCKSEHSRSPILQYLLGQGGNPKIVATSGKGMGRDALHYARGRPDNMALLSPTGQQG